MGEVSQFITRQLQLLLLQKIKQAQFTFVHRLAKRLQCRQAFAADDLLRAQLSGQQYSAFLERLADGADLGRPLVAVVAMAAQKGNQRFCKILWICFAARENQRP